LSVKNVAKVVGATSNEDCLLFMR